MPQIHKVLDALEAGCATNREIQAYTGLKRSTCAVWLTRLKRDGWVKTSGTVKFGGRGRHGYYWRLVRLGN